MTGSRDERNGFESRQEQQIILFYKSSRQSLEPTQPPVQWVSCFFFGKKRPGRDVENNLYLAPGLRTVELHIYYSYIHPQRWQELLFLYFVYSIRVDTNLALVFVWIICNTKFYGFWRRDISIFIKCKGVCFHYLKQFNLIGVKQAWNFVSSTTKPKYKLS